MKSERAIARNFREILRHKLQHESHDADLYIERTQHRSGLLALEIRQPEYADTALFGGNDHRIRRSAGFFRRTKHARYFITPVGKCLQRSLAKVLLPNHGDAMAV